MLSYAMLLGISKNVGIKNYVSMWLEKISIK